MGADMVVVDNPLSPSQQRVLSEELGVQVLDRAALILDIFAQRARTREGRLQDVYKRQVLALLTGLCIFGGVRRISAITSGIVPVMAAIYIALGLFITVKNIGQVPYMLSMIVSQAFDPKACLLYTSRCV